ncbi:hypothetical protein ACL9RL_18720 [Plantibacter sp. Mn2098]|uniref:hypothetical protein n=1 Tax=Plantibacter sp. Mn2098 TaxID=3395266 RepID=UPI003BDBC8D7
MPPAEEPDNEGGAFVVVTFITEEGARGVGAHHEADEPGIGERSACSAVEDEPRIDYETGGAAGIIKHLGMEEITQDHGVLQECGR